MHLICESALTSKLSSTGTLFCWVVRFTLWPHTHTHTHTPTTCYWVTCPTLQTWFNNNPVLNLALHRDEESSSAMFLHFYQISGSPWEVGLQESHTLTILVTSAQAEIQGYVLEEHPQLSASESGSTAADGWSFSEVCCMSTKTTQQCWSKKNWKPVCGDALFWGIFIRCFYKKHVLAFSFQFELHSESFCALRLLEKHRITSNSLNS